MSDQKPEEEKKPVDYLDMAKEYEKRTAHEWEQTSIACSLIFIGEQLAELNKALGKITKVVDNRSLREKINDTVTGL